MSIIIIATITVNDWILMLLSLDCIITTFVKLKIFLVIIGKV